MPRVRFLAIAGALLASTTASAQTAAPERLYLANDDHTDYFWALDDVGYRQAFQDMISFYLDQADSSASNAVDARGRFNLDGALWVYEWEHNQPAAQMDRLMAHVAAGDISLQLHSLVLLGGAMPTEAVLRDMMYAGRLERRYPVHVDMAVMMENQTLAGGLASLWAGAGAKYSWRGICDCATALSSPGDRDREIYTFAGHDGQSVLMKWNSLVSNNQSIGGYAEAFDPSGAVNVMENDAGYRARMPFPVKAAFGFGWDAPETETDAFITAAQTLGDEAHEIIVSNEHDFFEDFSASVNVATDVPLFVGSHGNEWDLLTASLAKPSAQMRRSMAKLRAAEGLSVIVANADPSFLTGRFDGTDDARELAQLHMGMFYDHDWTADSPIAGMHDARAQFERDTADQVSAYVDALESDAVARLAQLVPAVPGRQRFLVANPVAAFVPAVVELPGIS
ncbi:MAG TPA: glycoside hydrolase, partial [Myxococcota bacterium]